MLKIRKKMPTITRDTVIGFAAVIGVSTLVMSKLVHKHELKTYDERLNAELQKVTDLLNDIVTRYELKELSVKAYKED